jgi:hypothetical protein
LVAWFSVSITSAGVVFGAMMPYHALGLVAGQDIGNESRCNEFRCGPHINQAFAEHRSIPAPNSYILSMTKLLEKALEAVRGLPVRAAT